MLLSMVYEFTKDMVRMPMILVPVIVPFGQIIVVIFSVAEQRLLSSAKYCILRLEISCQIGRNFFP